MKRQYVWRSLSEIMKLTWTYEGAIEYEREKAEARGEANGKILGVNKKYLVKLDKSLQIRAKKEIDVTVDDICKSLNMDKGPWLKEVYSDIEYKISMNKLKNNNKDILEYIIKKYKKHTI